MPRSPVSRKLAFLNPRSLNTKSVRFRTTAGAVVALLLLFAGAGVTIDWFVGRQVQQSFDAALLEQATDRAALLRDGSAVETLMSAVGDEALVVAVSPDGQILSSFGTTQPDLVANLPLGVSEVTASVVEAGEDEAPHLEELRAAVAEAPDGTRIIVANEGEAARDTRSSVRTVLATIIPLTALAAATVAWFITGRALEPVKAMRSDLDHVVHAHSGRRVTEPGTGDEIDELGTTINEVLDRLDEQSLAQRQFVANASHELKSPLANARAIIDTSASQPDNAEFTRVTTAVGGELNRLHALVDDLLYLARDDEGVPSAPVPTDLADLIFDECERIAATSAKRIDASQVAPVEVIVDAAEIARAVRNLIENAERFASERVTVGVKEDAEAVTIIVGDDGPGIPEADRALVFERFSRLETDRARTAGGTGLGLSIVASIAERNGGSVSLTESPAGGAQFELALTRPTTMN